MQRIAIWIPTDQLRPGEGALVLGPASADGTLDSAAGEPGGRRIVRPERDNQLPGWREINPAGQTTAGRGKPGARVLSRPLGPGVHQFAVRAVDLQTGALGAVSDVVEVYVNTDPRPARGVRSDAALSGGVLRFTFGVEEDLYA